MNRPLLARAATALCIGLLCACTAGAAEAFSSVPYNLGQIQDQLFRDAMTSYSPQYDALPRDRQIAAYVNMHKVLYNGQSPALSPREASMLHQAAAPARPAGRRAYDPWADPGYDPYEEGMGVIGEMSWGAAWGGW